MEVEMRRYTSTELFIALNCAGRKMTEPWQEKLVGEAGAVLLWEVVMTNGFPRVGTIVVGLIRQITKIGRQACERRERLVRGLDKALLRGDWIAIAAYLRELKS